MKMSKLDQRLEIAQQRSFTEHCVDVSITSIDVALVQSVHLVLWVKRRKYDVTKCAP